MIVGENQPQPTFTWVMAVAVQIMPNGSGRLHACITTEEWKSGDNERLELYRDLREANSDELLTASREVLAEMIMAIPDARSKFDILRGSE